MRRDNIFKRLFFSLLISVAMTLMYWIVFDPDIGCFPMTMTEKIMPVLINIGICIFTFAFSLTALMNKKTSVRQSFYKSFLAFMGLPLILFFATVVVFVFGKTERDNFITFFEIGMPTSSFCIALLFQFYRYRMTL